MCDYCDGKKAFENEMDKLGNSNLWQKWFLNLIDKYKAESEDKN